MMGGFFPIFSAVFAVVVLMTDFTWQSEIQQWQKGGRTDTTECGMRAKGEFFLVNSDRELTF